MPQTSPDTTQQAASDAGDPRLNAWLEVARQAYAYLWATFANE